MGSQAQLQQAEDAASAAAQLRFDKGLLEEKVKVMSERLASADAQLREARAGKTGAERLATAAERRLGKLTEAHDALKTTLSAAEMDRNSLDSELHACRDALAAAHAVLPVFFATGQPQPHARGASVEPV